MTDTPSASPPLVSVVMPVLHPHPQFFPEAVASILRQSLGQLELIIVEDPSPRSASEMLARFNDARIRLIRNEQPTGFAAQLNRGLAEARADLVARMDADDNSEPDRLAQQADLLSRRPDIDVLGTQLRIISNEGKHFGYRAYPLHHEAIVAALRRYCPLAHPSVMFRKSRVIEAGGYRPSPHPGTEDYELWCRLARAGLHLANLPEALLSYRIHPEGMKAARLRDLLNGTLAVKEAYWRGQMNVGDQIRYWSERCLLYLPPRLVLSLFVRTQYRTDLPERTSAGPATVSGLNEVIP